MRIDFYHVDAFEVAVYEPIWRALKGMGIDARLVGPPDGVNHAQRGWFDHERLLALCQERGLPLEEKPDYDAVGVTTQNFEIVSRYKQPRVRLMYGPVMFPEAWGLSERATARFDYILAHGPFYQRWFSRWKPRDDVAVVGYPRYDEFFAGKLDLTNFRQTHKLSAKRPVLLYLPTWSENSSWDHFIESVGALREQYQVFVRPHHCTVKFEPARMARLRELGVDAVSDAFELPHLLAAADMVLADVRSCALLEALACHRRVLGITASPDKDGVWTRSTRLDSLVPVCTSPSILADAVAAVLEASIDSAERELWRDDHISFRDGSAGRRSAEAILAAIEHRGSRSQKPAPPAKPVCSSPTPLSSTRNGPRVSIVLPTYNHRTFLPLAVESMRQQTFKDFELIIVNDGSTDGTKEYLDSLKDPRIRTIHQTNQRLPRALNAGFKAARGEFLGWISADNYCAPIFLEALVGALEAHPEAGLACSAFASIDQAGQITRVHAAPDMKLRNLLRGNPGNAAFLYRRECQDAVGLYSEDLEGAEDWDMWLRIVERFPSIKVSEITYYYRRHGDSMTARKEAQISRACGIAFKRALQRMGGKFQWDRLYPSLPRCRDREQAETIARIDFGSLLLQSAIAPVEIACDVLMEAAQREPRLETLANLAVGLARLGQWDPVRKCLSGLPRTEHKRVREIVDALQKALATGRRPARTDIPLYPIAHDGVELFEWEKTDDLFFSLTRAPSGDQASAPQPRAASPAVIEPPVETQIPKPDPNEALLQAEAHAREALALNPRGLEALKLLAAVCLHRQQWAECAVTCARILEQTPRDVDALLAMAECFSHSGEAGSARAALERALEIDPGNVPAREKLAAFLRASMSPAQLEQHLRELLGAGQRLVEEGRIPEALRELEKAAELVPDDADLLVCIGNLHASTGAIDAARQAYSRALQAVPGHPTAREQLVNLTINADESSDQENPSSVTAPPAPVPVVAATNIPPEANPPAAASKESHEMAYWRRQKEKEGTLSNVHYEAFFTTHFGLDLSDYNGKRVLDIGCGPRGSLEWANMAAERVGLDPLADQYLSIGASAHQMRYVAAPSEAIPFPDAWFDVVSSFNSLDHVADLDRTIREILRVLKPGGIFLLLTDVNHKATPCEPIEFSWDIVQRFQPTLDLVEQRHFEKLEKGGLYLSVREGRAYDHSNTARRYGILSARFQKPPATPGNDRAFGHLQKAFDILKERRFAEAQAECQLYREAINYDDLPRIDHRSDQLPRVSVVIVAYKIGQGLIHCLNSLAAATSAPPHEIIVVDNGGNEDIAEELSRRPILHIRMPMNVILSEGRNVGVYFARAPIAAFVDDDALVGRNYIASVVEAFETFDIAALRGKVLPRTDHPNNSRARHYNMGDLPFPADIDTEGNSAFRTDVFRSHGGMDPLLFGGEGVELSYRISRQSGGYPTVYWPFTIIYHDYAATDTKLDTKNSRHRLMRDYSAFKHPDLLAFHNKLVTFAQSAEGKNEGYHLLRRKVSATPTSVSAAPPKNGAPELNAARGTRPFFTICIPTYNRAQFIAGTVQSALAQTYRDFEIVIVDDGSTDNTLEVMRDLKDPRIRLVQKEHSGGPATRNRCITEARGEFLVWVDSDDHILPQTLELYANELSRDPDIDVLYGDLQVVDENLQPSGLWSYRDYYGWTGCLVTDSAIENRIPNVCTMVRKSRYAEVGGYSPDFPRAHDYEFWTRLAPVAVFKKVHTAVGLYRRHEQSLSKLAKKPDTTFEARAVRAMIERHGLRTLFPFAFSRSEAEAAGEARGLFLAALLMLKYGDFPAAVNYARRSVDTFVHESNSSLCQILEGCFPTRGKSSAPRLAGAPHQDREHARLIETALRAFRSGQPDVCAKACARMSEIAPEAMETLVLVGLSLSRWADPRTGQTAFRCVVQREAELAYHHACAATDAALASNPVVAGSSTDSALALSAKLESLIPGVTFPVIAVAEALKVLSTAAEAPDFLACLEKNQDAQTPLLFAILGLAEEEIRSCVEAPLAERILRVREHFRPPVRSIPGRESGYSFCIITHGKRPEHLRRQIESIRALRIPNSEILVGGDVRDVPNDVRRLDLADAAEVGRLGRMRNALGQAARFDHLIVSDDDMLFDPGFAEGLRRFGEAYDVMAVRILNPDRSRFWDWATTGGTKGAALLDYWERDPDVYVTGGFCVLKADVLQKAAWDDLLGFYQAEDVDFSKRLRRAGITIRFNPYCTVVHDDDRYTRVDRLVMRFDHLLGTIQLRYQRRKITEARSLLPVALRIAGKDSARLKQVEDLVKGFNDAAALSKAAVGSEAASPQSSAPDVKSSQPAVDSPGKTQAPVLKVAWQGSFLDFGSLSHVNRALTAALNRRGDVQISPVGELQPLQGHQDCAELAEIARRMRAVPPDDAQVTVRHAWPPDWNRSGRGALVVIQPWEFGALPRDWVQAAQRVDEFWVPSTYVRQCYVDSGVAAARVHVVPNGIDPTRFKPGLQPLRLATRKSFRFLFVGGSIHRKGIDALLHAYLQAFTADDDVCLVIKDFGGQSVYSGQTAEARIRAAQALPNAPQILYLNEEWSPDKVPALYASCHCLVHPYRGEGFGLPVLEAMACGLPVIVTAGGATDDFATDSFAIRVPSTRRVFGREISGMKLAGDGWLLEPDADELASRMRGLFENPDVAREHGLVASAHVREHWTWDRAAAKVTERLKALVATRTTSRQAQASPAPAGRGATSQPIELPPCALLGHLGTAREFLRSKKHREAWNAVLTALAQRPFHPEAILLLAEIAQAAGDTIVARVCAQHARDMAPGWKPARKFLKSLPAKNRPGRVEWLKLPPGIEKRTHGNAADGGTPIRPRLSVYLIVKNEERFIGQCLASIKPIADQIVVLDTGSTDRTVEIARESGAEIHSFTWCDDFSAARNAALQHVTGDWVLALDADEELPASEHPRLLTELTQATRIGSRLPLVNVGKEQEGVSYVPRLFRNAPGLFYVSRVHEQIFSSLLVRSEEWGLEISLGSAQLRHHGYSAEMVRDRDKTARNLRLLEQAVVEYPDDANLLMNLGLEWVRSGDFDQGLARYEEAFEVLSRRPEQQKVPELRETLLAQLTSHLMRARRFSDVIETLQSPVAKLSDLSASLWFTLGLALLRTEDHARAVEAFRQCIDKRHIAGLCPINPEILKAGPNHCLARCWMKLGRIEDARSALEAALKDEPESRSVQRDLARIHVSQGRTVEALTLLHRLISEDPHDDEAWRLGSEIALGKPELLEFALDWTGEAVKHRPADEFLTSLRAEALLLSGNAAAALPFLRQGAAERGARDRAALCLCELIAGEFNTLPVTDEPAVSREFLKWYQRLVESNAEPVLLRVNDRLPRLAQVLPTAARGLQAAITEAR